MTQEAAAFNEWANDMDQVYAPFNTYEDFKAAPEAPMYTFDENIVSDLFKDAHGFRPSGSFWVTWEQASNLRKQIIWDDLVDDLNRSVDRERRAHEHALDRFEGLVYTIADARNLVAAAIAAEREACAMELERSKTHLDGILELAASTYFIASRVTEFLAARIRARGDK